MSTDGVPSDDRRGRREIQLGDRVQWEHIRDRYRTGEVVEVGPMVGVRTDDGDGVVYIEPRWLEKLS